MDVNIYVNQKPISDHNSELSLFTLDVAITIKKSQLNPQSPEFIPSIINSSPNSCTPIPTTLSANVNQLNPQSPVFIPTTINPSRRTSTPYRPLSPFHHMMYNESLSSIDMESPNASPIPKTLSANVNQKKVRGTIYFYQKAKHTTAQNSEAVANSVVDPLAASHAHATPSPVQSTRGPASNVISMPDEMRSDILAHNETPNLMLDSPEAAAQHELPLPVDLYHSLLPLDPLESEQATLWSTYEGTCTKTGIKYCLRRLHDFRPQSAKCMAAAQEWGKLIHPNVVQLREVFTTEAFGDDSLILVYDYYPDSQTLLTKYFTPDSSAPETNGCTERFLGDARPYSYKGNLQRSNNGPLLPEATIWMIIMQLISGLRAMHQAGLACRVLDATKIIVTGKRVRFSFCGASDIAQFDPNATNPSAVTSMHQQEDLIALGRLVLALAFRCSQPVRRENLKASIEMVSRHYSPHLGNFIGCLLPTTTTTTTKIRSVTDLMPIIGECFCTQMKEMLIKCDIKEDEHPKDVESDRLNRILVKLNLINERLEYTEDYKWSEMVEGYMLRLFRNYLFHSITDDGRPWLDHAHIVQCLKKLDAGTLEKVQLVARDEQTTIIISYAQLKHYLENEL